MNINEFCQEIIDKSLDQVQGKEYLFTSDDLFQGIYYMIN